MDIKKILTIKKQAFFSVKNILAVLPYILKGL